MYIHYIARTVFYMFKTKMKSLKLWESALLIALSLAALTALWAQGRQNSLSEKLVRFHVIAVSDDDYEPQLKLRVRDQAGGGGERRPGQGDTGLGAGQYP